jgi:hypothetical protein
MKSAARYVISAIAICSWLAISNHCAFAALATGGTDCHSVPHHQQDADATACPFHSKPSKSKEPVTGAQCCKVLRAIVSGTAKGGEREDANASSVEFPVEECILLCAQHHVLPLLLDTGPPGANSFAELVLQRSLLAHAPPFLW